MILYSMGDLYVGMDDKSFCDISIHLGNLRIEYQCPGSNAKLKDDGTLKAADNRQESTTPVRNDEGDKIS
jgi:hypothetical protein